MDIEMLKLVGRFTLLFLSFSFSCNGEVSIPSPEREKLVACYTMIFLALNFLRKRYNPVT